MAMSTLTTSAPYIEIVTQPKKTSLRFRYCTESRKAGNIYGDNTTESNPTFPTIRVCNYRGPMRAMMLCVTEESRLHPHKLVGSNCRPDGICVIDINDPLFDDVISFSNVGVQCCKKDDVKKFIEEKKQFLHDDVEAPDIFNMIDLTCIYLMFRVYIKDHPPVPPVRSWLIIDKKHCCDLTIVRVSLNSCPADGDKELFILCNKVKRDDVEVVFEHGDWQGLGQFVATDVFKECAIVCKVPPFVNQNISEPTEVRLFLRQPSTNETSPCKLSFTYTRVDKDPSRIGEKRSRHTFEQFSCGIYDNNPFPFNNNSSSSSNNNNYNNNNSNYNNNKYALTNNLFNNNNNNNDNKLPVFCDAPNLIGASLQSRPKQGTKKQQQQQRLLLQQQQQQQQHQQMLQQQQQQQHKLTFNQPYQPHQQQYLPTKPGPQMSFSHIPELPKILEEHDNSSNDVDSKFNITDINFNYLNNNDNKNNIVDNIFDNLNNIDINSNNNFPSFDDINNCHLESIPEDLIDELLKLQSSSSEEMLKVPNSQQPMLPQQSSSSSSSQQQMQQQLQPIIPLHQHQQQLLSLQQTQQQVNPYAAMPQQLLTKQHATFDQHIQHIPTQLSQQLQQMSQLQSPTGPQNGSVDLKSDAFNDDVGLTQIPIDMQMLQKNSQQNSQSIVQQNLNKHTFVQQQQYQHPTWLQQQQQQQPQHLQQQQLQQQQQPIQLMKSLQQQQQQHQQQQHQQHLQAQRLHSQQPFRQQQQQQQHPFQHQQRPFQHQQHQQQQPPPSYD